MEEWYILKENILKANGSIILLLALENINHRKDGFIKVIGKIINQMVSDNKFGQT